MAVRAKRPLPLGRLSRRPLAGTLFWCSLGVFLLSRLIGLERFPIYFFTDEAIQSVAAADFLDNGFRDDEGQLFPTFFRNGLSLNQSVSVYAQLLPYSLFGHSLFATRATSVLIALTGTAAVGLTLRDVFRVRFWWLGVLLLSITPAWFLHSRTAFETVLAVSFYAWFLYFYLRYRQGSSPRLLYLALVFGALAFYSYNPGQAVILVTGLLLVLSDLRFHWENRRRLLPAGALLVLLALPYLRFQLQHPGEATYHLRILDSYWVRPGLGLGDKLGQFFREYAVGLSPRFWFFPDDPHNLVRHRLKGYGNIVLPALPFAAGGLAICLTNIRRPPYRALLIAALAAPVGGALADVLITRVLFFVVPAALLTALGLSAALDLLARRVRPARLAVGAFAVLASANFLMLSDALARGPTWYRDYGLYGLQYGGRQVAGEIRRELDRSPGTRVVLSPSWANGTDVVMRFFLGNEPRLDLATVDRYRLNRLALDRRLLFVMTPVEYGSVAGDRRFAAVRVEKTLPYPDGRPGFYFVRMQYSSLADSIFAAERRARRRLVREPVLIGGEAVSTEHSLFDGGQIQNVFDDDDFTLARTLEANPAVVRLIFPAPRRLTRVEVTTASMRPAVTVEISSVETGRRSYSKSLPEFATNPTIELPLGRVAVEAKELIVRVADLDAPRGSAHVHIREIRLP